MKKLVIKKLLKIICAGVLVFLLSLLKISFVWGSRKTFFSGMCMITPILAQVFGFWSVGLGLLFVFPSITFGIPTIVACACWRWEGVFLNIIVPLGCLMVFVLHPSVGYGFWFGFYWLIPVLLHVMQLTKIINRSIFITAIKSTLVAHAVGSVMWCYFVPMTPERWLALIPIVAVERLVFASGMVIAHRILKSFRISKINLITKRLLSCIT